MAPYSSTLGLENPMDGGAWWAAVHAVTKSQTRLSDFTFTFHFHTLEKEMATHSSVLAWRIPGTGEPGGLPSMGSHRVGHDWSDLAAAAAQHCPVYCLLASLEGGKRLCQTRGKCTNSPTVQMTNQEAWPIKGVLQGPQHSLGLHPGRENAPMFTNSTLAHTPRWGTNTISSWKTNLMGTPFSSLSHTCQREGKVLPVSLMQCLSLLIVVIMPCFYTYKFEIYIYMLCASKWLHGA